jgi:hypothetical protein
MQLEVTSILTAVTCAPPVPLVCAVSEPDWALTGAARRPVARSTMPPPAGPVARVAARPAAGPRRGGDRRAPALDVVLAQTQMPLGTFDVVHARLDLRTVSSAQSGPDRYITFAVCIEAGRQAPTKPSQMVALGR